MRIIVFVALLLTTAPAPGLADEGSVSGHAVVVDGQTLKVAGRIVRLADILAPPLELECHTKRGKPYACGRLASKALADLIRGQTVTCQFKDTAKPPTATCMIGPVAVNEQLLLTGCAVAGPSANSNYRRAQRGAQVLNEGLWKGRFPPPETWRR